jgi:hypothetical protein
MLAKLLTYVQHVNSMKRRVSMLREHLIVYFHYRVLVAFRHSGWMPQQRNVPQSLHVLLSESKPGWERSLTSYGKPLLRRQKRVNLHKWQPKPMPRVFGALALGNMGDARPGDLSDLAVRAGGKTELSATV